MPTVLRLAGFRFFFYSLEGHEPPHIHVERDDCVAKFWVPACELASSSGFRAHELNELRRIVLEHRQRFLEAWHEYFGGTP